MSLHAFSKEKALKLFEESNKIYKNHRFYFAHQKDLKFEINAIFESIFLSQNRLQTIFTYVFKFVRFSPNSFSFNPVKYVLDYCDRTVKDAKSSVQNVTDWFYDTLSNIKFLLRFLFFLLIFYAIFLFIFALNTFHLKEVFLLVIVFYTMYKLTVNARMQP